MRTLYPKMKYPEFIKCLQDEKFLQIVVLVCNACYFDITKKYDLMSKRVEERPHRGDIIKLTKNKQNPVRAVHCDFFDESLREDSEGPFNPQAAVAPGLKKTTHASLFSIKRDPSTTFFTENKFKSSQREASTKVSRLPSGSNTVKREQSAGLQVRKHSNNALFEKSDHIRPPMAGNPKRIMSSHVSRPQLNKVNSEPTFKISSARYPNYNLLNHKAPLETNDI
jgi:hypothetical protein